MCQQTRHPPARTHYSDDIPGNLLISQQHCSSWPRLMGSCHNSDQRLNERRFPNKNCVTFIMLPGPPLLSTNRKKTSPCCHLTAVFFSFKGGLCGIVSTKTGLGFFFVQEKRTELPLWGGDKVILLFLSRP